MYLNSGDDVDWAFAHVGHPGLHDRGWRLGRRLHAAAKKLPEFWKVNGPMIGACPQGGGQPRQGRGREAKKR